MQKFAYCFLEAVPMRGEPSHRAEMVNQLLRGDTVEVLEATREWLRVRSCYDGYEGWVSSLQLSECSPQGTAHDFPAQDTPAPGTPASDTPVPDTPVPDTPVPDTPVTDTPVPDTPVTDTPVSDTPVPDTPASDTPVPVFLGLDFPGQHFPAPDFGAIDSPVTVDDPVAVAEGFLGAPYLWGGRTRMGIDCSGLMQVAFGRCGIRLPRDASQQACCGKAVEYGDIRRGDLLFFDNEEGRIVHVGVATGDGHIVHASGWVRRDRVDANGIVNAEGVRTHHFAAARRMQK